MAAAENPFGFTLRPESPTLTGVERAWEDLAVAAECPGSQPGSAELAGCINANLHVDQFTPAISAALHDLVQILAGRADVTEDADAARLSDLIVRLDTPILTAALRTELDARRRDTVLHGSVKVLSIRAMMRVAQAASGAYHQPFSKPLRGLLRRIGREAAAQTPNQVEAQRLFRGVLARKFREVRFRTGEVVTQGYRDMFAQAPPRRPASRATPEADRIVQTAIETDAVGEVVWVAVTEMIESDRQRELIGMLKGVPPEAAIMRLIIGRIAHPELLGKLLQEDPVDLESVDLVIEHMGLAAAKVLLEHLAESRSRVTRREVYQRLVKLGPQITPLLEVRFKDRRWFVLRNVISLAREAGCVIDWHMMQPFLDHTDARVRREALLLLLRNDATYEPALIKGIADTDRNVLRAALQAARSRLPDDAVPVLAERITSTDFPPEFRVMTIHLLGRSNSAPALEALIHYVQAGKTLLGRPKLAHRSPEMLAALGNLARTWPGERRVAALLAAALASKDDEVRAAAKIQATT